MSRAKLIVRRRIGDVETPVGALLKLGDDTPGTFLFESIAGGERLGRYSFIGGAPQVWFRINNGVAETATTADFSDASPVEGTPVEALRAFVEAARAETEDDLPPMASGAFGYVGYDMIRLIEDIPDNNPEELGIPDSTLMRPRVLVIFDNVKQVVTIACADLWA